MDDKENLKRQVDKLQKELDKKYNAEEHIRKKVKNDAKSKGILVHIPSYHLCGDNAAMIAATGYHYLVNQKMSGINDDVYSREIFWSDGNDAVAKNPI